MCGARLLATLGHYFSMLLLKSTSGGVKIKSKWVSEYRFKKPMVTDVVSASAGRYISIWAYENIAVIS
jgi:hypothetical protein